MKVWHEEFDPIDAQIKAHVMWEALVDLVVLLAALAWVGLACVAVWSFGLAVGVTVMVVLTVGWALALPRLLDRYATRREVRR